jgi:hypothetical protein
MALARNTRDGIIVGVTAAAIVALLLPFAMRSAPPAAAPAAEIAGDGGLAAPTVDEMCAARGAVGADLEQCRSDESAAQEYVGAWMGLYGFLNAGGIDAGQIQLEASLDDNDPLSSHPELDPTSVPGLDVSPDEFQSPAQVAFFCLARTDDWLLLHDCLAQNDPDAGQGDGSLGAGLDAPAEGGP